MEAMGRVLDPSQPWVKDSRGRHTNLAALLDWPDLDSDEEVIASMLTLKRWGQGKL